MSDRKGLAQQDMWTTAVPRHRHFALDTPPRFCEECGKDWTLVVDGRKGRRLRRERVRRAKP